MTSSTERDLAHISRWNRLLLFWAAAISFTCSFYTITVFLLGFFWEVGSLENSGSAINFGDFHWAGALLFTGFVPYFFICLFWLILLLTRRTTGFIFRQLLTHYLLAYNLLAIWFVFGILEWNLKSIKLLAGRKRQLNPFLISTFRCVIKHIGGKYGQSE